MSESESVPALRVALVAGSLRRGGAEKQLWHLARGLRERGAAVRVFSLTRGEHYEKALEDAGVPVVWIGRGSLPPIRLIRLLGALARFRPHVVQATHAFVNLYAALGARAIGAVSVGALRGSLRRCVASNGIWAGPILRRPTALVCNSQRAASEVRDGGLRDSSTVFVLENAIDLAAYAAAPGARRGEFRAVVVGSLARVKRVDVFLDALAQARRSCPGLRGRIVGEGSERVALTEQARREGLLPDGVEFLGERSDVPRLLGEADVLVSSSDDEGLPNAVLEAMAAGLPVVATPAGDTSVLVEEGRTGYLVGFGDAGATAARLRELYADRELAARLGRAGRERVAARYAEDRILARALEIYREIAARKGGAGLRTALAA